LREQASKSSLWRHHLIAMKLVFYVHRITSQESPSEKVIAGVLTETSVSMSH
jgi:hypothetical protein